jgi:hypothetical protein
MSDSGLEFAHGHDDHSDELVDFAGLPCLKPVQEAFEQHFTMGFFEAMVVLREWTDLSEWARAGITGDVGAVTAPHRTVVWETRRDSVILTITDRQSEPKTYSLEWRARRSADGTQGTYVHAFWLGGAGQRPTGPTSSTKER